MPAPRVTLSALLVTSMLVVSSGWVAGEASAGTAPKAGLSIAPGNEPLQVKFVAQSGGFPSSVVSFAWTFGDGTSSKTETPTVRHTYRNPGTYSPTVTEIDSQADKATAAGRLRVLLCPEGSAQCSSSLTSAGPVDLVSARRPYRLGRSRARPVQRSLEVRQL